jgi:hypothetical protein
MSPEKPETVKIAKNSHRGTALDGFKSAAVDAVGVCVMTTRLWTAGE